MNSESLLDNLNPEQLKAVQHTNGPLMIVAGAGTGKTTVITRRLAWLIDQGLAKPDEILALTFTEKASGEMAERVDRLLPYGYVDLWVSTFHAFGERVLRDRALDLGLDPGFKVLSTPEQWFLIRQNMDDFKLKYYRPQGNPTRFIYALVKHFSRLKDENITAEAYLAYAKKQQKLVNRTDSEQRELVEKTLEAAHAFSIYQQLLKKQGWMDFGDLIIELLNLLQKRQSVLNDYRRRFKYILVDEFQDTNLAQYQLIKLLALPKNNLTVCGDDDQSIFKFRGASVSNILQFKTDFPKSADVVLVQNYRNKQNILDLAYNFIQFNNPNRLEVQLEQSNPDQQLNPISKKLNAQRDGLGVIEHLHGETGEGEVKLVMDKIAELRTDNQADWNDFAILVRANDTAQPFINALIKAGVPYQFVASKGLYQKPEIIDLISYLRLLDNYHESDALYRVLSMGAFDIKIGQIINLTHFAHSESLSLFQALERHREIKTNVETRQKFDHILELIATDTELTRHQSVGQILYRFVNESGLIKHLTSEATLANSEQILNINRLFDRITEYESRNDDKSVRGFLEQLRLMMEVGQDPAPAAIIEGPETVKVMTVHASKGLEFRYVFLVQMVDKRFPSIDRSEQIEVPAELIPEYLPEGDVHLQEERRLFYVAVTRARDGLFFTSAERYSGQHPKKLSRFLTDLDDVQKTIPATTKPETKSVVNYDAKNYPSAPYQHVLPDHLSFSQLKSFTTCPYQYRYSFLLKVPHEPRSTFGYGQSLHNTLAQCFAIIQQGKRLTEPVMKQLYAANWLSGWYDSPEQMTERKRQGWLVLKWYLGQYRQQPTQVLFLEKGFHLKIGDTIVKGVVDRIDQLTDGTVEIIDYKTGQRPKTKKGDNADQLYIYAAAVQEVLKLTPSRLTYVYLDDRSSRTLPVDDQKIAAVKTKFLSTAKAIQESTFPPTPGFHCQFCDFRNICEFRQI